MLFLIVLDHAPVMQTAGQCKYQFRSVYKWATTVVSNIMWMYLQNNTQYKFLFWLAYLRMVAMCYSLNKF